MLSSSSSAELRGSLFARASRASSLSSYGSSRVAVALPLLPPAFAPPEPHVLCASVPPVADLRPAAASRPPRLAPAAVSPLPPRTPPRRAPRRRRTRGGRRISSSRSSLPCGGSAFQTFPSLRVPETPWVPVRATPAYLAPEVYRRARWAASPFWEDHPTRHGPQPGSFLN